MIIASPDCETGNIFPSTIEEICGEDSGWRDICCVIRSVGRRGDDVIEIECCCSDEAKVFTCLSIHKCRYPTGSSLVGTKVIQ